MEKKVMFILSLIGSVIDIIAGIVFSVLFLMIIRGSLATSWNAVPLQESGLSYLAVVLSLIYFLAAGGFGIYYALKERKEDEKEVRQGGIGCLVCGILTLNVFLIIGGIFGILETRKEEEE